MESTWRIIVGIALTPLIVSAAAAVPVYIAATYILTWASTYISTAYTITIQQIIKTLPAGDTITELLSNTPWWTWLAWPAAISILTTASASKAIQTRKAYRRYREHVAHLYYIWYIRTNGEYTPIPYNPDPGLLGTFLAEKKALIYYEKCLEACKKAGIKVIDTLDRRRKRFALRLDIEDKEKAEAVSEAYHKCGHWLASIWYLQGVARDIYSNGLKSIALAILAALVIRSTPPPPPNSPIEAAAIYMASAVTSTAAWITSNPWLAPYITAIPAMAREIAELVLSAIAAAAIADRWTLAATRLSELPGVEAVIPAIMLLATPASPAALHALAASTAFIAGYRVYRYMFRAMVIATASTLAKKMNRVPAVKS